MPKGQVLFGLGVKKDELGIYLVDFKDGETFI